MGKPTAEQVAWVFEQIIANGKAQASFRVLIYNRMEFGREDYSQLYAAGGQIISNAMIDWFTPELEE